VFSELELGAARCRRRAHRAGGDLRVLLADRGDHLGGRELPRRELAGSSQTRIA
jgi:hypothetical protein